MRPVRNEINAAVACYAELLPEEFEEWQNEHADDTESPFIPDEEEAADLSLLDAAILRCRRLGLGWTLSEDEDGASATITHSSEPMPIGRSKRSGPGVALFCAYLEARADMLRERAWRRTESDVIEEQVVGLCPSCEAMPLLVEERGSFCPRCGYRAWEDEAPERCPERCPDCNKPLSREVNASGHVGECHCFVCGYRWPKHQPEDDDE